MIVKPRKLETSKRKVLISPRNSDPFSNMIHKNNKSPVLKPVCVRAKHSPLLSCRSVDRLLGGIKFLPPISPSYRGSTHPELSETERNLTRTPNFSIPGKLRMRDLKNYSEMKYTEVSFGETDEGSVNVNGVLMKYR